MPMKHFGAQVVRLVFRRSSGLRAGFTICGRRSGWTAPAKGLCGSVFRRVGTASSGLKRETAVIDLKDTAAADPIAFRLY